MWPRDGQTITRVDPARQGSSAASASRSPGAGYVPASSRAGQAIPMAHSMRQMAHSRGEVATDTHAGRPSLSGRAQGIALVAVAIVLAYRPAPEITNPAELRMQPVRSASSSANDGSVMGTPHLVVTTQPDSRHNRPRRGTPTNVLGTPGSARRVSLFLSRRECPSRYGSNRRFAPGYYPWAQDAQGQLGEGRPG